MRSEYQATHPWLTFELDLRRPLHTLMMALGECKSKCEHIAGVPLDPETADEFHLLYLAKGVQGTTAIEGNTLTLEQVQRAVSRELDLPPSQEYLVRELDNIVNACNYLAPKCIGGTLNITPDLIRELNKRTLDGLPVPEHVVPGQIRNYPVGVFRYRGAPHAECAHLLNRLCEWLSEIPSEIWGPGSKIPTAIIKAIVAHVYIAWIHPFGDGNGRTARLLEFCILTNAGMPTPAAHLLSNHYNQTRSKYYQELDRTSQSGGDILPFIEYAVEGLRDGLSQQIQEVRKAHWEVAWKDFVYKIFSGQKGETANRRRELVFALSSFDQRRTVRPRDIRHLTPMLAAMYANKTRKTVTRDLNELEQANLIVRDSSGVRARVEVILAWLPARKPVNDGVQEQLKRLSGPVAQYPKAG